MYAIRDTLYVAKIVYSLPFLQPTPLLRLETLLSE
jgi:hypothetical protein